MPRKLTQKEICKRLSKINIKPLEQCKNVSTKVLALKNGRKCYITPSNEFRKISGCTYHLSKSTVRKRFNKQNLKLLEPYKTQRTPTLCKCLKCGYVYHVIPKNVFNGDGCPRCAGNVPYSQSEIKRKLLKHHFKPLQEIHGTHGKILMKCTRCGSLKRTSPQDIFQNGICFHCRKNQKWFRYKKRVEKAHLIPLEKFFIVRHKVWFKCPKCGLKFRMTPSAVFEGEGCPRCAKHSYKNLHRHYNGSSHLLSQHTVVKRLLKLHFKLLSQYHGNRYQVKVKCLKCGYIYKTRCANIFNGLGCPNCTQTNGMISKPTRKKRFKKVKITPLEKYRGANHYILFKCNRCHRIFYEKPVNAFAGHGCPFCSKKASLGEDVTNDFFYDLGLKPSKSREYPCTDGDYVYGYRNIPWLGKEHLDFYFPQIKLAIEINGRQHYEAVPFFGGKKGFKYRKACDFRKKITCELMGIKLISINTHDFNGLKLRRYLYHQLRLRVLPYLLNSSLI